MNRIAQFWRAKFDYNVIPSLLLLLLTITLGGSPAKALTAISNVKFGGSNANLTITISGHGFGPPPPGVPCNFCAKPFLQIGGHIGCAAVYNITSWKDSEIILTGVQANPGSNVLFSVTNPQNNNVAVLGAIVPKTIALSFPQIKSVVFTGRGRSLKMTINGSRFGPTPPGLPGEGNLPFFAFTDQPLDSTDWQAGYANCGSDAVDLNYTSWSDTQIVISGFGSAYGQGPRSSRFWTVAPGDVVAITVAGSRTNGLVMSYYNNFASPAGTGTVWGGVLP